MLPISLFRDTYTTTYMEELLGRRIFRVSNYKGQHEYYAEVYELVCMKWNINTITS